MHTYFPPRSAAPTAGDLHVADARWQAALERGRRYRDEAQAQVGLLLTPDETAQRLGVSPVTVNTWRRQDKMLGLRFDDHQYVYPFFQFAFSEDYCRAVLRDWMILELTHVPLRNGTGTVFKSVWRCVAQKAPVTQAPLP